MFVGYGLVYPAQARDFAVAACELLGHGASGKAVDMLMETAAAETHTGLYRDPTMAGAGRGLFQCDLIAFQDVQHRADADELETIIEAFGFDLRARDHAELDGSPLLAALVCRLFYLRIPERFPSDVAGRARYWKRYYNTELGRGTTDDYLHSVEQYKF